MEAERAIKKATAFGYVKILSHKEDRNSKTWGREIYEIKFGASGDWQVKWEEVQEDLEEGESVSGDKEEERMESGLDMLI